MSKLGYKIQQALDDVNGTYKNKSIIIKAYVSVVYFFKDIWYDYPSVWISNVKYIIRNFKLLYPHIVHMRDWDQSYQLNLFCDSLEYLAQGLKRHNNCVHSLRNSRRCLFAAKRLRSAYDDRTYLDKSYRRLTENNPIKFVKLKNGMSRMTHDYGTKGEEYYSKMFKLIHKRQDAIIKEEKKQAWLYLHKHFESFWD